MTATLESAAVELGSDHNHVFTYRTGGGMAQGKLHIMLLTDGREGRAFSQYQKHEITPTHTRFDVPPPPALRGVEPYLLLGVVTDPHRPDVPQAESEFFEWLAASNAPFHWSGQIATKKQFDDARRAAAIWEREFWFDPQKRSTVELGIAAERFAALMYERFPANRVPWTAAEELVEQALERSHVRAKRDAQDLKPCVACMLALTVVGGSVGLGVALAFLLRRVPFSLDNLGEQPRVISALMDWIITRIAVNYRHASMATILGAFSSALVIGPAGAYSSWKLLTTTTESICREYTDCGERQQQ